MPTKKELEEELLEARQYIAWQEQKVTELLWDAHYAQRELIAQLLARLRGPTDD